MEFKFRKASHIGISQAELDDRYLQSCYVDSGYLELAFDTKVAKIFVNGRTGTGKTALLLKLASEKPDQVVFVRPEALALSHISNSNIIRFFESLGVRMDPFYKLLWRHTLAVELIKLRYNIKSEEGRRSFLERLSVLLKKDKGKEEAVKYLITYGDSFWQDTERRITETTQKIESQL
jgi:GTPase SAR1 family protein